MAFLSLICSNSESYNEFDEGIYVGKFECKPEVGNKNFAQSLLFNQISFSYQYLRKHDRIGRINILSVFYSKGRAQKIRFSLF